MIDFYRMLSFSVYPFISMGTRSFCNIDSYVYSSVQGTLDSIKAVLSNGRINDSYSLLRKYYDSSASFINPKSSLHFGLLMSPIIHRLPVAFKGENELILNKNLWN